MTPSRFENRRILVVDDNEAIHADFRKIFRPAEATAELDTLESELFGPAALKAAEKGEFLIDAAHQGQQGLAMAAEAKGQGRPYAVAFVDIRMPPGWDGIETALRLWAVDPSLQVVICTAYSDYSWEQTVERLGAGDRFLILKKPFDTAEVRQLALALSAKWQLAAEARVQVDELERRVSERTAELTSSNALLQQEISGRKRMEAELMRSQKLQALGQLVAGIAHEINNPLGFILGNLAYLEEKLNEDGQLGDVAAALLETTAGAIRIRDVVRDLKLFSRSDESVPQPVDVHDVIESAITVTRGEVATKGRLIRDFGAVPRVYGNGSRLGQVFLNLIINAVQAQQAERLAENTLVIRTRSVGGEVVVELTDNGCGIPQEILGRIFDPFFTTKPVGQGTGLGLAICHGIIEGLGGRIEVSSPPGRGTTFTLHLRAEQGRLEALPSAA